MKVNFGEVINDGRGKIAGVVYSRNRSGAYARSKVSPMNPQTSYQMGIRAILTGFAKSWGNLSKGRQKQWDKFGIDFPVTDVFGKQVSLSGINAYVKLNSIRKSNTAVETLMENPPLDQDVVFETHNADNTSVSAAGSVETDVLASVVTTPVTTMAIWLTPRLSPGKNYIKNQFRFAGFNNINAAGAFQVTFDVNRFTYTAGDSVGVRVVFVNTENYAMSTPQEMICTVVA